MRVLLLSSLLLVCIGVSALAKSSESDKAYAPTTLLYHQNAEGKPITGSVADLKKAIRNGQTIRLYMNLGAVEHLMDAGFISIFNGHVYAQIDHINGQRPNRETGIMELRENTHVGFYSTRSPYEIKWFALP